jgi:hypothetical protein
MIRIIPVLMAGALSFSGAAFGQTPPPQPSNTQATQVKAPAPKPDAGQEVVCKRQEIPGSRLGGTRVCHTRAEWDEISRIAREQTDRTTQTVRNPN